MGDFERSALTLLILSLILPGAVCNNENNCTEERLKLCKDQFDENSVPVCPEILELGDCLQPSANCVTWSSQLAKLKFHSLLKKLTSYPDCIRTKSGSKKECSKDSVSNCYQQFNQNATPICPEVKRLRQCISELSGCHAMKHPLYVLSREILDKHRDCFYVNYSRILEVLKKKDNSAQSKEGKQVRSSPSENTPLAASTTASGREAKGEQDTHSSRLPYTFVVVATVFTCLFLVVLVVFSIVRHTTSSKRQRNVTVERAPVRIRIHSPNSRPRTRRHRHRHNNRRHVVVQGAQQTVSGFFEGNVPPPPYSAVLDDTESIRAGDPPPPYRPPSCVAIGVIV